ncbi:MAG: ferritin family protein [Proteobacteria bacterium]|nr:ferritin family protein [Pseudomonadota bacterium]
MDSLAIFKTAVQYEEKIRDLYRAADGIIDDDRGIAIFRALADDEQSHVDFLLYSLEQLKAKGAVDIARLKTSIPAKEQIETSIESIKAKIPEKMLGDIKKALNSALLMEKETSAFYRDACTKTDGEIRKIFEKFLEIEDRHVDVVQIELDHAMHNGVWFDFMEIDLEAE